jgi:hypothetical protein
MKLRTYHNGDDVFISSRWASSSRNAADSDKDTSRCCRVLW